MSTKTKEFSFHYGRRLNGSSFTDTAVTIDSISIPTGKELYQASCSTSTREEAEAIALKFPKYCRPSIHSLSGSNLGHKHMLSFGVWVQVDDRTGAVNETAMKRRTKIVEILKTKFGC